METQTVENKTPSRVDRLKGFIYHMADGAFAGAVAVGAVGAVAGVAGAAVAVGAGVAVGAFAAAAFGAVVVVVVGAFGAFGATVTRKRESSVSSKTRFLAKTLGAVLGFALPASLGVAFGKWAHDSETQAYAQKEQERVQQIDAMVERLGGSISFASSVSCNTAENTARLAIAFENAQGSLSKIPADLQRDCKITFTPAPKAP